jgi:hypothetical protein
MVRPDVQMFHAESGKIYYNGRIYDVVKMATGWVLTYQSSFDQLAIMPSVDEICSWLMATKAVQS